MQGGPKVAGVGGSGAKGGGGEGNVAIDNLIRCTAINSWSTMSWMIHTLGNKAIYQCTLKNLAHLGCMTVSFFTEVTNQRFTKHFGS